MRVISGRAAGRRLIGPGRLSLRPTSDRVREGLFSILGESAQDQAVLDLYAGVGTLGIEALSRGAARAVFVEKDRRAARVLKKNIEKMGFSGQAEVLNETVARALGRLGARGKEFALVLADPPYGKGEARRGVELVAASEVLLAGGILVMEHRRKKEIPGEWKDLERVREARYGDTCLTFYHREEASSA